ncbi:tyrosine-type recombinase/integrase [Gemmata sp.]|uniref:tyrosine-type recombinase/integrase n=1 Tax=Gemmata sp. TaxID=1914242 RepID=UPI003F6E8B25
MAHLVRQAKTYYTDPAGKRVPKGTPGAKKVTEKSAKWYGCGIPGLPPNKRVPLAATRDAAQRMLNDLVRRADQGRAGMLDRDDARKTLAEHLTAFEGDVALGLGVKGGQKRTAPDPEHVALVVARVRAVVEGCGFKMAADLAPSSAPQKVARYLQARVARDTRDGGFSPQTADFHLAAARRFVRWLARKVPVPADLLDGLPGFNPKADRRHARREIGPVELADLIETTRASKKVVRGLTGTDRATLYLTAFATGYRAGELSELGPENFDLDTDPPAVVLPARLTKNKKAARQPIQPGLAELLGAYLAGKPRGRAVWPGTWGEKPAKVLRVDLAAAGIPYCVEGVNGKEYADFHALRHSYLSALSAAGVGAKELQELARHSDPRLTLGIYTHSRVEALGASVAKLQIPGVGEASPLSRLSRQDLERAVVALAALVRALTGPGYTTVTPRVTPALGTPGDSVGPSETL